MAEAAVTFLLENVQNMMLHQIDVITGFKGELEKLESELDLMKAFLEESANKREKGVMYRQLERQIREVAYKAEDTIDDCLRQSVAVKSRRFGKLNPKRLDLAKRVRTLREEVQSVFSQARMGFSALPMLDVIDTTDESPRAEDKKIPSLREGNVVGLNEEAESLIKTLNEKAEKLEVISIIGMPGLGKTTLAWKIYRDKRIQYEFLTLIWVYVSQDFNVKEIFLTILKTFSHKGMTELKEDQLAQEVKSCLEKRKFLLFLDDVWTPEAWKHIEAALPLTNISGKVLITSRNEIVALSANPVREPHKLRFLDPDESWELLQLEVWGNLDKCPIELEVLGKDIAKQCGGVPLAIVVTGGILAEFSGRNIKDEWRKVAMSVTTYLAHYDNHTENIIMLSYNMLPHDLRDCFLYLGMFPEDSEIPAWKLTRLWMAEGFIQRRPGKSLEEVAEENLVDLVARNLVMVDRTNARGEVKSCRVHDMIRDFCKYQAASAKQNLFQEVKMSEEGHFNPPISEIESSRRLCIHSGVVDFLREEPKGPFVRSFLCFSNDEVILPQDYISSILDAFNLVRVLDVNPIKFSKFPAMITHLIHLKYIALSGDSFKALPDAISKLWNLQTIKIDTLSRTFELRADIWKMMQLRHFKTKAAILLLNKEGKRKGEGGKNLQSLNRLSTKCCTEDVFSRAPNLKNLGIRGQLSTLLEATCLEKLDRLQKLKLVYDIYPDSNSQNPLPALPSPERFPPNLRTLTLSSTYLEWKHMATLGELRSLEVLKLKENAFMGRHWESVDDGFPYLEVLHISRTDLEFWMASGNPFPKLKCLILEHCEKLEVIPSSVLEKSLEILNIERVTKSVVKLAKEMEKKKQQMPNQKRDRRGTGFKLIIAPGDEK